MPCSTSASESCRTMSRLIFWKRANCCSVRCRRPSKSLPFGMQLHYTWGRRPDPPERRSKIEPAPMDRIRILATGGTFDKEYNELTGELFFKSTHTGDMLALGRCLLDVEVETLMMIDSL